MTPPPIRQVEPLEQANARLRAPLARRPEQLPRWVVLTLAVEAMLICGGSAVAALVGASVGRALEDVQHLPLAWSHRRNARLLPASEARRGMIVSGAA
jgi:hypothetical protein